MADLMEWQLADAPAFQAQRHRAAYPRLRGARPDEGDLHDRSGHVRPAQLIWDRPGTAR